MLPPLPGTPPPLFKILASVSTALVRESVFRDTTRLTRRVLVHVSSVLARTKKGVNEASLLVRERRRTQRVVARGATKKGLETRLKRAIIFV